MRVCGGKYITASLRVCEVQYCTQRGGAGRSLHTLERPVRDASGRAQTPSVPGAWYIGLVMMALARG
jgi:hypothetical protein